MFDDILSDNRLHCLITGKLAADFSQDGKRLKIGDVCLIRFARICKYQGLLPSSNVFYRLVFNCYIFD